MKCDRARGLTTGVDFANYMQLHEMAHAVAEDLSVKGREVYLIDFMFEHYPESLSLQLMRWSLDQGFVAQLPGGGVIHYQAGTVRPAGRDAPMDHALPDDWFQRARVFFTDSSIKEAGESL